MSSLARWAAGLAIGALVALNSLTFGYVVSIERRLTRLETIDELARRPRARSEGEGATSPKGRSVAGVEIAAPVEHVMQGLMIE